MPINGLKGAREWLEGGQAALTKVLRRHLSEGVIFEWKEPAKQARWRGWQV